MKKKMNLQKAGGFAALYCAAAYLVMIAYFLGVVDYPSITEQSTKIEMFINNQTGMTLTYLLGYAVFGIVLALLCVGLHDRLKAKSPDGAKLSAVYGIMWATLLLGTGMVFINAINTAVAMYPIDPAQAITVFTSTESVALGLSFSDGEIIGGLWTLLVSIIALKSKEFNKGVNILGIIAGTAGILSVIPAFNAAGGTSLFGIGQMIWYIWIGIILLKGSGKENG